MKFLNNFLTGLTSFTFGLILFSCQLSSNTPKLPNIVLIMADDMGYECIGANGSTEYYSPNIDKLANNGIRFDNCYSQPLCTPSRVKIMTGKYNFRNYEDFGYLNPDQITFGNLLKQAGYSTCIAGKWQLNGLNRNNPGNQDTKRPYHFGFDEYCLWQLHHTRAEGERFANALITQNGKDLPRDPDIYGPQVFADFACDFIERNAGSEKPFFVYYPMVLVHDPFVPTPDSPEWADPAKRYENDTAYFADMMAYTDKIVGQIEKVLKDNDEWENTLFIFTADNGTHPTIFSNTIDGVIQGGKGKTINSGNHVPLVIHWPKKIIPNINNKSLVSFADFLPTFCEAAGIQDNEYSTDGRSLIPVVQNDSSNKHNKVFIHYTPRWGSFVHDRWVMDERYKLYRDGRFYDTDNDPLETKPISELTEKEKEIKEDFKDLLIQKENEFPFEWNNKEFKPKR